MKIPIKRYVDDPALTWEERYRRLEAHHKEETAWMISEIERLGCKHRRILSMNKCIDCGAELFPMKFPGEP